MKSYKQFAVLGLGIFGSTIAKTLSEYGHDVIAIDKDPKCVERLTNVVAHPIVADVSDINQLKEAGLMDCDVVIVSISSNLEASILAVINAKELGIKTIMAKAKNKQNMRILKNLGVDRVVRPEKDMGYRFAKSILFKDVLDMFAIDNQYAVVEMNAPSNWWNKSLIELDLRRKKGINIIGIRPSSEEKLDMSFDPNYVIQKGNQILLVTTNETIDELEDL